MTAWHRDDTRVRVCRRRRAGQPGQEGSAVVEFTLVVGLLLLVFAAIVELALLLHVRDVVTANAAEGARYEANAGSAVGSGSARAESLMTATLGSAVRSGLSCVSTRAAGVVAITCSGRVDLPFLPFAVRLTQTGHALLEPAP